MVTKGPSSLLLEPGAPQWAQRLVLRLQDALQGLQDARADRTAAGLQRGALLTMTTDLTAQNLASLSYSIPFNSAQYDTDGFHNLVANNSRITIPVGVKQVKFTGNCRINLGTSGEFFGLQLAKNGATGFPGFAQTLVTFGASGIVIGNISSPVLNVVAGDYFTLNANVQADTSVTIEADTTWFAMEVVA